MIAIRRWFGTCSLLLLGAAFFQNANANEDIRYWMKVQASDKFERSMIAETGVSIEAVREDFVAAIGTQNELEILKKTGRVEVSFPLTDTMDFPKEDSVYHNYSEVTEKLQTLVAASSKIAQLSSIGKSFEGRDIWVVRISGDLEHADNLPAAIFMGGHHAREHLSIELPLYYIEYLLTEYQNGNPRIQRLINGRDIHIIPMVNPDGAEYDIATGSYKTWRKNRSKSNSNATGVDLNRNYAFQWGGGGASKDPTSDVYRGPTAFSEPESIAVKNYIESHANISILLSFHTFSKLILYPWGHTYDGISVTRDKQVHEVMAKKMATWNGYDPRQSSSLYIASGDTTDWSYGVHKIISFTFELDPESSGFGSAGFYPGARIIPEVQRKNLEPVLYLIEYADNPYRSLEQGPIFKP